MRRGFLGRHPSESRCRMVGVAQLAEHRIVAPVAMGSNPFTHPSPKPGVPMKSPGFFCACSSTG